MLPPCCRLAKPMLCLCYREAYMYGTAASRAAIVGCPEASAPVPRGTPSEIRTIFEPESRIFEVKRLYHKAITKPQLNAESDTLGLSLISITPWRGSYLLINNKLYELVKIELINSQYPPTSELLKNILYLWSYEVTTAAISICICFENPSNLIWVWTPCSWFYFWSGIGLHSRGFYPLLYHPHILRIVHS